MLLDDASAGGRLFADLTGYRPRPALTTLLAWSCYWAVVAARSRRKNHD